MKKINVFLILSLMISFGLFNVTKTQAAGTETVTFAGGCFWCMTPPFETAKARTPLMKTTPKRVLRKAFKLLMIRPK